jgi:hypothetical protein
VLTAGEPLSDTKDALGVIDSVSELAHSRRYGAHLARRGRQP